MAHKNRSIFPVVVGDRGRVSRQSMPLSRQIRAGQHLPALAEPVRELLAVVREDLAAISCNLLRAAGALASRTCARARGATLRRDLIDVAARTARHGRGHLILHLPEGWHRQQEWASLFQAATGPPAAAA